ncbi:hypothetical protein [Agaribacter flavus]|uniref:DUF2306 domain-containing protein n=1 Tax=Agaribacter flavus TaxID=1902781 RepID=A0ABV7FLV3_9ALTE
MYLVSLAGGLMSAMVIVWPTVIKANYIVGNNAALIVENIRVFWALLGLLSLLTFVTTRHGIAVLHVKENRSKLKRWSYLMPVVVLSVLSLVVFSLGIYKVKPLHMAFGVLGVLIALGIIRYTFKAEISKKEWLFEHIGSTIGSGIGIYIAFLSFGGRRILQVGGWEIMFWITPFVIGISASFLATRKYRRQIEGEA